MHRLELAAVDRAIVKKTPLFSSLSEAGLGALLEDGALLERDRGEVLFTQGERARAFYVVLDGWVKIHRTTPGGEEAVVGVFTHGESFGEAVCFSDGEYPVGAETVTRTRLLMISARRLVERIRQTPEIGLAMLASTSKHLQLLVRQIEELKAHTGAERVAEFLIGLASIEQGSCILVLPYEKALIAGRLGMKPESLSRAFQRLRPLGVRIDRDLVRISDVGVLHDFLNHERGRVLNCALLRRSDTCMAGPGTPPSGMGDPELAVSGAPR